VYRIVNGRVRGKTAEKEIVREGDGRVKLKVKEGE
jgi:hypothetical protein